MWLNLVNWTIARSTSTAPCVSNIIKRRNNPAKSKSFYTFWAAFFSTDYLEGVAVCPEIAGFTLSGDLAEVSEVFEGFLTQLQMKLLSTLVLSAVLICNFTVVVLVGGAAEHPASGPELQDLQQQQTGHGREALLEQEAVT